MAERRRLGTVTGRTEAADPLVSNRPKREFKPLTADDLFVPEGMTIPNFLRRVPYVKYEPKLDKTVRRAHR